MSRFLSCIVSVFLVGSTLGCHAAAAPAVGAIPNPAIDAPLAAAKGERTVFQHVKGVISVTSGYSGGSADTAHYEMVSDGNTGHAESVRITYDPSQVSFGQLLKVFFAVAHDPTELNRQGPDTGSQYRSAIFYADEEQKRIAQAYVEQLNKAKVFPRTIVTQVVALKAFYAAEAYHQDYAMNHPDEPYIAINDLPKVENLRKQLSDLYVSSPARR